VLLFHCSGVRDTNPQLTKKKWIETVIETEQRKLKKKEKKEKSKSLQTHRVTPGTHYIHSTNGQNVNFFIVLF